MKKLLLLSALFLILGSVVGQKIKGPESISYFQAPANGVKFLYADVFINSDKALADAKRKAQEAKNSAMGSKFGALGSAVAKTANSAMDYSAKLSNAIKALQDDKGRFAVWNFVPPYIIANTDIKEGVVVEIYVLNEEDPSPSAGMGLKPDKNGYYDLPYYINCRYKVTTARGEVIMENNLGVLSGTRKTKNYTPPTPGAVGSVTVTDEGLTEAEKIGINVAYNTVRQDVFARFGFGTFSAPIKLGVIKEIKQTKKLVSPIISIFENKRGLLLNSDEKAQVQNFVDIIEPNIGSCSDKTRWVAYHNLSVCYAWLENPDKAIEYYKKYGEEIKVTLEKMRKWNLLLQGKLPKEEQKGVYIGMKDMKKFRNYKDIETFVTYYPAGAIKYKKLFKTINRDLGKFVDFYAYNDLLCQLYEIDYPFQFFPLQGFSGTPKKLVGTITKEGMEPINYTMKFDSKRRIKQLETEQVAINADGSKEKLFSRELKPVYDDDGQFQEIVTDAGIWASEFSSNIYFSGKLNATYDPVAKMTYKTAKNITKNAGFLAGRTSDEAVQLKVDLDGNIYFTGISRYFKANAIFKDIITQSGIKTKRTDTKTDFSTLAVINDQGVFDQWNWTGNVTTSFVSVLAAAGGKVQKITADKMIRDIKVVEKDDKGNPTKIQYVFEMKGKLDVSQKMSLKEWFSESYAQGTAPKNKISSDGFEFGSTESWDCTFKYDDQGNWIEMKVGPYTATRTYKY